MDVGSSLPDERRRRVVLTVPEDFLRIPVQQQRQASNEELQSAHIPGNQAQLSHYGGPAVVHASSVTQGKLSVTLAQAKLGKNYGYTRMDPYARIRIGHYVFETDTDTNGAVNPRWDKTFTCYVPPGMNSVYVEIFDERTFGMDERIAWGHFTVPQRVFDGEIVDDWFQLSGKQGEHKEGMVEIVFSYQVVQLVSPNIPRQIVVANSGYPFGTQITSLPGIYAIPQSGATILPQVTQIPPPVQVTEEDVKQLKEMFPNIDNDVISSVLYDNQGSKSAAINALLSLADE